mmetsp:Transcript_478/g.702  ORF Transcript_478/g.702 Transcript_478/m.702 type:complete len:207 (-) Transcript_478:323-943(-)
MERTSSRAVRACCEASSNALAARRDRCDGCDVVPPPLPRAGTCHSLLLIGIWLSNAVINSELFRFQNVNSATRLLHVATNTRSFESRLPFTILASRTDRNKSPPVAPPTLFPPMTWKTPKLVITTQSAAAFCVDATSPAFEQKYMMCSPSTKLCILSSSNARLTFRSTISLPRQTVDGQSGTGTFGSFFLEADHVPDFSDLGAPLK